MLIPYLQTRYVDGGRGETVDGTRHFDCWGLAIAVRVELFGLPELPAFGRIGRSLLVESNRAYQKYAEHLIPGDPVTGAIAAAMRGGLCLHVGVVVELDGRMGVLETGSTCGPRWQKLRDFERHYQRVIYYRDRTDD
ncbi:hypothetical protein D3C78_866300 [compost metagenome]